MISLDHVVAMMNDFAVEDPDYSAQLCVYHKGQAVLDHSLGDHLGSDSIIGVFSSSKGVGGVVIGMLVESGSLALDTPVSHYWPEFAAAGKSAITVREALSHRAGLVGVQGGFTLDELIEHEPLARRLASQRRLWQPGVGHGYHAVTIGVLIEELVRRVTGGTFKQYYDANVRIPLAADFHFGLDAETLSRVVPVLPPLEDDGIPEENEVTELAFSLAGMPEIPAQADHPLVRDNGPVAIGGVGSARGLAAIYAACLPSAAHPLVGSETVAAMAEIHAAGEDLVLGMPTRYGIVFQVAGGRLDFGSPWAFGHGGAGGSLGYADPQTDIAFGYTVSRMPSPAGEDPRALKLARAIRRAAHGTQDSERPVAG